MNGVSEEEGRNGKAPTNEKNDRPTIACENFAVIHNNLFCQFRSDHAAKKNTIHFATRDPGTPHDKLSNNHQSLRRQVGQFTCGCMSTSAELQHIETLVATVLFAYPVLSTLSETLYVGHDDRPQQRATSVSHSNRSLSRFAWPHMCCSGARPSAAEGIAQIEEALRWCAHAGRFALTCRKTRDWFAGVAQRYRKRLLALQRDELTAQGARAIVLMQPTWCSLSAFRAGVDISGQVDEACQGTFSVHLELVSHRSDVVLEHRRCSTTGRLKSIKHSAPSEWTRHAIAFPLIARMRNICIKPLMGVGTVEGDNAADERWVTETDAIEAFSAWTAECTARNWASGGADLSRDKWQRLVDVCTVLAHEHARLDECQRRGSENDLDSYEGESMDCSESGGHWWLN